MFKQVRITQHAVTQMRCRYAEWSEYTDAKIREKLEALAISGTPVGGQMRNDIAVEITLSAEEKTYLVGHATSSTFVVRTVLPQAYLIVNMRSLDIRAPAAAVTRERQRCKQLKKSKRYAKDHAEPEPQNLRTKRDQKRSQKLKQKFDDDTPV
jgi:hypothetical protein